MDKLNRREFLRLSALAAAGVTVAACAKTEAPAEPTTAPAATKAPAATATPVPQAGPLAGCVSTRIPCADAFDLQSMPPGPINGPDRSVVKNELVSRQPEGRKLECSFSG